MRRLQSKVSEIGRVPDGYDGAGGRLDVNGTEHDDDGVDGIDVNAIDSMVVV